MTVAGNLAFQSGAMYLVQINPTTASFANVTGTAALAGTVQAVFSSGGYLAKQYDILHSTGLGGSSFTTLATTSLPANFTANLSYTATDVLLNLTSILGQTIGTGSLNQNQQNVANSLNGFFNNGGSLPANFLPVFGLTGPSLGSALSQLDGEDATGAEHAAFTLMSEFFGLVCSDPFLYGRDGGPMAGPGALGFAPDQQKALPPDIALAYADAFKAQSSYLRPALDRVGRRFRRQQPEQRRSCRRLQQRHHQHLRLRRRHGLSLLARHRAGLRTRRRRHQLEFDTRARHRPKRRVPGWPLRRHPIAGPAYVAAALAFANNCFTTNRTAFAGDQLSTNFQGQNYGARPRRRDRNRPSS